MPKYRCRFAADDLAIEGQYEIIEAGSPVAAVEEFMRRYLVGTDAWEYRNHYEIDCNGYEYLVDVNIVPRINVRGARDFPKTVKTV